MLKLNKARPFRSVRLHAQIRIYRISTAKGIKTFINEAFKHGHLWKIEKIRQDFEVYPKCARPSNAFAKFCRGVQGRIDFSAE